MKKVLVSAIAVLAMAGIVNAAAIGLEWAGNTATATSEPTEPNMPITAQFYLQGGGTAAAQPTLSGIGLVLNAWLDPAATIPANGVVFQTSATPLIPGWATAAANNNTDLNGLQFAAANGPDYQTPVGKTYLMDITLQYTDPTPPPQYYITIKRDIDPTQTSSVIFDQSGADFITAGDNWVDDGSNLGKAKWSFGNWGGSAWFEIDYYGNPVPGTERPANPLILVTPEPASLALLVLGGFAALRRR